MANRNWLSNKMYQMEAYPVLVSCTFVVDNTNAAGVSNLTGGTVQNVWMNSVAAGGGNPNPVAGVIQVNLQDNYSKLLGMSVSVAEPTSGVNLNAVSVGVPYVISVLGTTTTAQWQAVGLPVGVTPALGQCFVATVTGPLTGTGRVQTGVSVAAPDVALAGDPNAMLQKSDSAVNGGAQFVLITRSAGAPVALTNGTKVRVNLYLSNSSVTVNGQ